MTKKRWAFDGRTPKKDRPKQSLRSSFGKMEPIIYDRGNLARRLKNLKVSLPKISIQDGNDER